MPVLQGDLSDVVRKISVGARNVEARVKRALNFPVQHTLGQKLSRAESFAIFAFLAFFAKVFAKV